MILAGTNGSYIVSNIRTIYLIVPRGDMAGVGCLVSSDAYQFVIMSPGITEDRHMPTRMCHVGNIQIAGEESVGNNFG